MVIYMVRTSFFKSLKFGGALSQTVFVHMLTAIKHNLTPDVLILEYMLTLTNDMVGKTRSMTIAHA